jgi:uncharacterized lipoprotein YddW (UPF0748 family)
MPRMRKIKRILSLIIVAAIIFSQGYEVLALALPTETIVRKSEFRGVWIPTVYNLDWPALSASVTVEQQKQQYIEKLDKLKNTGMNAVMFQVRSMGDAFYESSYSPWSRYLTGTQGTNPGYDPLKFTLEEAHKKNMEFHAWFNPFRISDGASFNIADYINKLPAGSPLKSHPEWIVKYADAQKTNYWLNPGIPEVRDYVVNIILEVVNIYDIDGVHIDDYYYPYPLSGVDFPDGSQYAQYGAGYANKGDWRRDNVNKFISELSSKIKTAKAHVKFGVSPFGIWKNGVSNGGSDTAGLSSYDSLYTDSLNWINKGYLDYIIPQIYWNFGYAPAAYEKLVDWWTAQVKGKNISLYIGHAAYKIGDPQSLAWLNPDEMPNQINYNRQFEDIKGDCFYSSKDILSNKLGIMDRLKSDTYKYPALIPAMPWKDSASPVSPAIIDVKETEQGITVSFQDKSSGDASYFVVYRFGGDEAVNIKDSSKIAAIMKKGEANTYSFTDSTADINNKYVYVATSVDRLHNESDPSNKASNEGVFINAITTDKPSPQKVNNTITITADLSAEAENLSRFSVYDGKSWRVLSDYSSSNTASWTPVRAGNYTIRVEVKASATSEAAESYMDIAYRVDGLYKVFVDPGHGGSDPGTLGFAGTEEKVNNLSMSFKTRDLLRAYGFDVMMSRESDIYIGLTERATMANNWKSSIFVSIHQNAFSDPAVHGIETYSYPGSIKGGDLAKKVQDRLIEGTGANNRNAKTNTYVVLEKTNMPAILVEAGFLSNEEEEKKLNSDPYQNIIAESILTGILDYYGIIKEDVTKDSIVDIKDISSMARNYNKKTDTSSDEKYMDINNDGIIDIFDLVLVSKKLN